MSSEDKDTFENEPENNNEYQGSKNFLEWTVFAIGLFILSTILAYLIYKTYTHEEQPADIKVEYTLQPAQHSPFRFLLTATNTGGETAENVIIEMELQSADTTLEKSELNFHFIPQSSKREGFIIFKSNPADADSVTARVVSFNKP